MATTLGEIQLEGFEETDGIMFVSGRFKSLEEQNVYNATNDFGVTVLREALEQLGLPDASLATLRECVDNVSFATPNAPATTFKFIVSDLALARSLRPIAWDSYRLG